MNTGKALQTERLLLLPGVNARDNNTGMAFLKKLMRQPDDTER